MGQKGRKQQEVGISLEEPRPNCDHINSVTPDSLEEAHTCASPLCSSARLNSGSPTSLHRTPTSPPQPTGSSPGRVQERAAVLTLRGTVSEEGHKQRHIINVLQVGPHLMDAPGQFGLKGAQRPGASGWGAGSLCFPFPLPSSLLRLLQGYR